MIDFNSLEFLIVVYIYIPFLLMGVVDLVVLDTVKVDCFFLMIDGSCQFTLNSVRGSTENLL